MQEAQTRAPVSRGLYILVYANAVVFTILVLTRLGVTGLTLAFAATITAIALLPVTSILMTATHNARAQNR